MIAFIRHWREAAIGLLLLTVAAMWIGKATVERQNGKLKGALADANRVIDLERERVRTRTALARAQDAANAARVERDQEKATKEAVSEYQNQLAALRARYSALLVRAGSAGAVAGSGGSSAMSGVPDASGRADGAPGGAGSPVITITPEQALAAETYRLQLITLQDWIRDVAAVDRGGKESAPAAPSD